jgi:hypothetical protein
MARFGDARIQRHAVLVTFGRDERAGVVRRRCPLQDAEAVA